jgi:hypothetical protein
LSTEPVTSMCAEFTCPCSARLSPGSAHPITSNSRCTRAVSVGGPHLKPAFDPRSLTSDEITRIGHSLYDLLRSFSGYQAAIVGWNPESLVDLKDLETDWRNGDPPSYNGLVLTDDLCKRWRLGPEWSAFEPGYRWLPYSGSRNVGSSR